MTQEIFPTLGSPCRLPFVIKDALQAYSCSKYDDKCVISLKSKLVYEILRRMRRGIR